jgi:hypothetical protein
MFKFQNFVIVFIIFLCCFLSVNNINAFYDPLSVSNNKYGIHIADPNDLKDVRSLVNSSGGDWGYVTLVIPDSDKNSGKWQQIFNEMRKDHLIPIVRLATHVQNDYWVKPDAHDIDDWISFLNSLNWPIENRYVILFNEPNHAKEWGNSLDPEGYADLTVNFAKKLKDSDSDYYILPAGLDDSAANGIESMDAEKYWDRILKNNANYFDYFDGLTSHSYPNPAFSGYPWQIGRGTLLSYQWELNLLNSLGVNKNLPVFITETGWMHNSGKQINLHLLSPDTVASYYTQAAASVWQDNRIVCITPFVFNYQDIPFDHFSWKTIGASEYYSFYNAYKNITKIKGDPIQRQKYEIDKSILPFFLVSGSEYNFSFNLKNSGQNILNSVDGYKIEISDKKNITSKTEYDAPYLEPNSTINVSLKYFTPNEVTNLDLVVKIGKPGDQMVLEEKNIRLIPPPSIQIGVQLGWKIDNSAKSAKVLIYDRDNHITAIYNSLPLISGIIKVTNLHNIIPHDPYRIVVIVPYYLPRQLKVNLTQNTTNIKMSRFYPFDINQDGNFSINDLWKMLFFKPEFIRNLFF